jgi:hypothetical protein
LLALEQVDLAEGGVVGFLEGEAHEAQLEEVGPEDASDHRLVEGLFGHRSRIA